MLRKLEKGVSRSENRLGLSSQTEPDILGRPLPATVIAIIFLSMTTGVLHAQSPEFTIEGRPVQIHGFASQAFAVSDNNNYLTMKTSEGSFAFTDFGVNISAQITGKFRVGAQIYDRNIGNLGQWHPELDWAGGDYRFKDWLGLRAGKVKTVLGLYNDTQDMEFLHTWAILPQSMYPLDLRSSTIAHVGADFYGDISLKRLGSLSYTAYAGFQPTDHYGGWVYGFKEYGINLTKLNGRLEGGDLRWRTPVPGLLAGVSYLNQDLHATLTFGPKSYNVSSTHDATSQFYVQYVYNRLKLDGEYRRNLLSLSQILLDSRSFYGAASYRISKRFELGTYYSRFYLDWQAGASGPGSHIFEKTATARIDLASHWDIKIEGHFMHGYAQSDAFRGFYPRDNPLGLVPTTNLLVIRTGFQF
ncbi:MAG TPA: hypothetical protein VGK64_31375 [Bryobacteraceae bacterium]